MLHRRAYRRADGWHAVPDSPPDGRRHGAARRPPSAMPSTPPARPVSPPPWSSSGSYAAWHGSTGRASRGAVRGRAVSRRPPASAPATPAAPVTTTAPAAPVPAKPPVAPRRPLPTRIAALSSGSAAIAAQVARATRAARAALAAGRIDAPRRPRISRWRRQRRGARDVAARVDIAPRKRVDEALAALTAARTAATRAMLRISCRISSRRRRRGRPGDRRNTGQSHSRPRAWIAAAALFRSAESTARSEAEREPPAHGPRKSSGSTPPSGAAATGRGARAITTAGHRRSAACAARDRGDGEGGLGAPLHRYTRHSSTATCGLESCLALARRRAAVGDPNRVRQRPADRRGVRRPSYRRRRSRR